MQWSQNCSFPDLLQDLTHKLELNTRIRSFLTSIHNPSKIVLNYRLVWKNERLFADPASIYLFEVNNSNTRTLCDMCSKLTIKSLELRHRRLMVSLLLLIYFTLFSGVPIVDAEQVNTATFRGLGIRQQMKKIIPYVI